jgi:threonine dehydrogenase-like Zn-dependent dehydrogenase
VPTIKQPTDAILRVTSTALCGSDLHYYRGHLKCDPGFTCGHEFVGEIVEKGSEVTKFNLGDKVSTIDARLIQRRMGMAEDGFRNTSATGTLEMGSC